MAQTTRALCRMPLPAPKRLSLRFPSRGLVSSSRQQKLPLRHLSGSATIRRLLSDSVDRTLPSLADLGQQVFSALTTFADVTPEAATELAQSVAPAVANGEAVTQAATKSGPFTWIADSLEAILKVIDSGLEALHVPYSYGFAIILLTVLVKILTFPLSKQQVESSIAMQGLQPQVREIQEKHKNNPQMAQQLTAQLYQSAGVNPLAGCLPTLATIPVFIGLYRALLNAAEEGVLTDGFFVIPSLAGPTTISARQAGMGLSWLFPFKDGAPPIGWHDAGAYLVLPGLLVISQYVSQNVLQPTRQTDPSQAGMQTFLKVLPLLLGWFSLNVPSGLALYWITNNVLTTGQQFYLKKGVQTPPQVQVPSFSAPPTMENVIDTVAEESKPRGVTSAFRKRVKCSVGAEIGARRSKKQQEARQAAQAAGYRRGDRFRARKAREAAKKAKSQKRRSPKKQRKPFVQEEVNAEVVAEFEKELGAPPLLPLSTEETEEVESQGKGTYRGLGGVRGCGVGTNNRA